MKNKVFIIIGAAVLLIAALMVAIPQAASSRWGNETILNAVNQRIPGKVAFDSFTLSWFGSQKIEGLKLFDPKGEQVVTISSIATTSPLYSILFNGAFSGDAQVKSLCAKIKKNPQGYTNLQECLGDTLGDFQFPIDHDTEVADVDLEVSYDTNGGLALKTAGATKLNRLSGSFNIDLQWNGTEDVWNVDIKDFPVAIADGFLAASQPQFAGVLRELLGESVNIHVSESSQNHSSSWNIEAKSNNFAFSGNGIIENDAFHLTGPASAKIRVTPRMLKSLSRTLPELADWTLASESEITLDLTDCQIPLSFFTTGISLEQKESLEIQARVALPGTEFISAANPSSRTKINDFSVTLATPKNSGTLAVTASGAYFFGEYPIQYRFDTQIRKPTSFDTLLYSFYQPLEIEFTAAGVPSSMVDLILGTDAAVTRALGPAFNVRMKSSAHDPRSLRLSLISEKLDIPEILLSLNNDIVAFSGGLPDEWSGTLAIERLLFKSPEGNSEIHALTIPWSTKRGLQEVQMHFTANTPGSGRLAGNLLVNGRESLGNAAITLEVKGENVPSAFAELVTGRPEISALFGPRVNPRIVLNLRNMKGTIKAEVKGQDGSLHLNGHTDGHYLYLSEPFVITAQGQRLGPDLLASLAPVFKELVQQDGPIKLTLSPENFAVQLTPFSIDRIQFEKGVLELGRLTFENAGEIREVLSVLKPPRSEHISIWATPLYLSMRGGILNVYRMDMLILDRYPLATWGSVDFTKDQVNMVIGITGTALMQILQAGYIKKEAMLQVPVRGHVANPKIDSGKAARKIGALLAHQSGGPEGLVLGTVLDLTNGKDQKVPPPTTDPLPWGNIHPPTYQPVAETERTDPIKEIQKEAGKLLKGLFK